jgi:ribosome biogenesis GTPase A
MAAPSLPPSREASVKAEVAAIVKDELDENNEPETSPVQLQTLFQDVDVKTMEKGVDRGLELLYKISKTLEGVESPDIKAWREQITKIRKQAEFQKCVIGVVGNTGAGKSSVINALLDEERVCDRILSIQPRC